MLKVLLLDDSPADVDLVRENLQADKLAEVRAVTSRDAFEAALRETWDIAIVDCKLPGFDGFEALRMAREQQPQLPVIFLSGTVTDEMAVRALHAGAVDYLLKDRMARLPDAVQKAHERRQTQAQEQLLKEQLLKVQRMQNIGSMAVRIAHDLNNVLTPSLVAFSLVRPELSAPSKRILDIAETRLKRGAEMVKQITTFIRGTNGGQELVDIAEVLRPLLAFFRQTSSRLEVLEEIEPGLPGVLGNATELDQVFLNLCVNAQDAMSSVGTIYVSARVEELHDFRTATSPDPVSGRFVAVTVRDDGAGIAPEMLNRIFDPFVSTKAKGTGLGLSMVLEIVRGHHGHIHVTTELWKGSAFTVYLPVANKEPGNVAPRPDGTGATVLLVDDETSFLEIARSLLEMHNYRVLIAANGAEALTLYQTHHKSIVAVVTDLVMPVMGGAQLAQQLRLIEPSVRIVCATGLGGESLEAMKANVVLRKPYTPEQLFVAIAGAL